MPKASYLAVPAGAFVPAIDGVALTRKSRYLSTLDSDQLDDGDLLAATLKDRIRQPMDVYELVELSGDDSYIDEQDSPAPDALWAVLVWQYANKDEVFLRTFRRGLEKCGDLILLDDGEIRIPAEEARTPGGVLDYARRALDHLDLIG